MWVRQDGDQVVVTAIDATGPVEVCRHVAVAAGQVSIDESHYPQRRNALARPPRATKPGEAAFLRIGIGAAQWLTEAAGLGVRAIDVKMADAVALCAIFGDEDVDRALGVAAVAGRFAEGDLISILRRPAPPGPTRSETHSLQPGTAGWDQVGR